MNPINVLIKRMNPVYYTPIWALWQMEEPQLPLGNPPYKKKEDAK